MDSDGMRRQLCELLIDSTCDIENVECDNIARLRHFAEYTGPGWYSLDDDDVFRIGVRPTYCRIRIHDQTSRK